MNKHPMYIDLETAYREFQKNIKELTRLIAGHDILCIIFMLIPFIFLAVNLETFIFSVLIYIPHIFLVNNIKRLYKMMIKTLDISLAKNILELRDDELMHINVEEAYMAIRHVSEANGMIKSAKMILIPMETISCILAILVSILFAIYNILI